MISGPANSRLSIEIQSDNTVVKPSDPPSQTPPPNAALTSRVSNGASTPPRSNELVSTLANGASKMWGLTNVRNAFQMKADDAEFKEHLAIGGFSLGEIRQNLNQLSQEIGKLTGNPKLVKNVRDEIKTIDSSLNAMINGTPKGERVFKGLINLLNMWPVVVPSPVLGDQGKTFAYTVAAASNAAATVSGDALVQSANGVPLPFGGGVMGEHSNEVHLYPAILGGSFVVQELLKKFASPEVAANVDHFGHQGWFHALLGTAAAGILVAPFFKDVAANAAKHVKNKVVLGLEQANMISAETSQAWRVPPGLQGAEAVTGEVRRLLKDLDEARQAVKLLRGAWLGTPGEADAAGLPGAGKELTRVVNTQVTQLLEGIEGIDKRIKQALGPEKLQEVTAHTGDDTAAQGAAEGALGPEGLQEVAAHTGDDTAAQGAAEGRAGKNPDLWSKMTLAAVGAIIAATTVVLIQPEPMGTVDLAADGAALTAVMVLAALQQNKNREDSMERLKNMASTSLVMCLGLGADKIAQATGQFPKGMIEMTEESPYIAAGIMVAMVMLLPGPAATALEWGLTKAGNAAGAAWNAMTGKQPAITQAGDNAIDMDAFKGLSEKEKLRKLVELVVEKVGAPQDKGTGQIEEIEPAPDEGKPESFHEKYEQHKTEELERNNAQASNRQQLQEAAQDADLPYGIAGGSKPTLPNPRTTPELPH